MIRIGNIILANTFNKNLLITVDTSTNRQILFSLNMISENYIKTFPFSYENPF